MVTLVRLAMIIVVLVIVFFVLPEGNGPVASTRQATAIPDIDAIEKEARRTGRVVRWRSASAPRALAEASEDERTTAAIKAQYVMDPRLSVSAIYVETIEGVVTLSGRVDSAADVAYAIGLAMRHDSVREVISTLQFVRPAADAPSPRTSR